MPCCNDNVLLLRIQSIKGANTAMETQTVTINIPVEICGSVVFEE